MTKRILLVDDSELLLAATSRVLEQQGHEVTCVNDPASYLPPSEPFHLALVDLRMPNMSGDQVVEVMRVSWGVRAPIFLFSGEPEADLEKHVLRCGADGYASKAWGPIRVAEFVDEMLATRSQALVSMPAGPIKMGVAHRVLVLDDSEIVCKVISAQLREVGYQVEAAQELGHFEQLIGELEPELILADVNMPGISGDELCRNLKGRPYMQGVPIVLMSSMPQAELAQRAKAAGADGTYSKGSGLEPLTETLDGLFSEVLF